MKRLFTLLLLLIAYSIGYAQINVDTTSININSIDDSLNISRFTQLYIDSTSSLPPEDIIQKTFTPLENFKYLKLIPPRIIHYHYYIKFSVFNNSDSTKSIYLYPGQLFDRISIFKIKQKLEPVTATNESDGYKKITLAGGEKSSILVYLRPVKNIKSSTLSVNLIANNYLQTFKIVQLSIHPELRTFGYVISGILLMMIIFMGSNYFFSRRPEFLYNSVYSICMFFLIFFNAYLYKVSSPFANFYMSYFDFFLQITGILFYISFIRSFVNTAVNYKRLNSFLKYGQGFVLLLFLVYTYLDFFTNWFVFQVLLENSMKFFILIIGVIIISVAIKHKDTLFNYLAAGNAALIFFSAISLALIWSSEKITSFINSTLFYYYLGIVFELIFFQLGLSYKNRSELVSHIKEQEAMKLEAEKKEFETQIAIMKVQQDERNRISADMHDDLGAGMTTIRLYSELAKRRLGATNIPEIEKISSSSNELLNKMNAIIWSMSSSNDSLGNLTAYIRSYALEYFENTGINCRISIPEDLPNIEVSGEIRRNVFLGVKEALHNIIKHSKATEVTITLIRVRDGLTLFIQDNGVGINLDELPQFGNGLKNMKKRMEDISMEFSISNNNGTLVTLHRKINHPGFF